MRCFAYLPDGSRVLVLDRKGTNVWIVRPIRGKRSPRRVGRILGLNPSRKTPRRKLRGVTDSSVPHRQGTWGNPLPQVPPRSAFQKAGVPRLSFGGDEMQSRRIRTGIFVRVKDGRIAAGLEFLVSKVTKFRGRKKVWGKYGVFRAKDLKFVGDPAAF